MASRHYRAQVVVPNDNGLPKDSVVNTWHYMADDALSDATNAIDFNAQLDAFYTGWVPTMGSTQMDWANSVVKHYVFEEAQPRIPFFEDSISPGTPNSAGFDLPAEVAACLTLEGTRVSGANMRRRRGRIYLGPFAFGAVDMPLFNITYTETIVDLAETVFFGSSNSVLAVYSPYTHHGVPIGENIKDYPDEDPSQLLLAFHEVTKVWMDNAWDTQRRRGVSASMRHAATK